MHSQTPDWTPEEQLLAEQVFQLAYQREINALIDQLKHRILNLESVEHVWELHDYLSLKRHEIDGRFDLRYPTLLFVFASLLKDGVIRVDELQGLAADKLAKIAAMATM